MVRIFSIYVLALGLVFVLPACGGSSNPPDPGALGDDCNNGDDCASGFCNADVCAECEADADCMDGETCVEDADAGYHVCQGGGLGALGDACTDGAECASGFCAGDVCSEPVPTMEGPVMGAAETGTAVCVYKGIPYAAPPMGELRWKAPQPAQQRSSTLSALSFGPECAQKGSEMPLQLGKQKIEQSEDCLYLNIWRPMKSGSFPVMVSIIWRFLVATSCSRVIKPF